MKTPSGFNFAIQSSHASVETTEKTIGSGTYYRTRGYVSTPLGIVAVDSWQPVGEKGDPETYMRFVWAGREHSRTVYRGFTSARSLATVAGRFAREIAEG